MSQANTVQWNSELQLRWGTAATTRGGGSGHGLVATAPFFLLTDPDVESIGEKLLARRLVDGYMALATAKRPITVELIERTWDDAVNFVEGEMASITMVGTDFSMFNRPSVAAALLVAVEIDGKPAWYCRTEGDMEIIRISGDEIDEVDTAGRLVTMDPGVRHVMMTRQLQRSLSAGRIRNVVTQLTRAERASAVLVSQTPPSSGTNAGVIVVDTLDAAGAADLEFPATLDGRAYAESESGAVFGPEVAITGADRLTADWALRILGIEGTDEQPADLHGKRSASAPPEIDDFIYVSYLGSGGFADVYLYEEQTPRRYVAIKVLKQKRPGSDQREAFRAEIDLMAQLSGHPSVVTIYDADVTTTGQPYIVMQYCPAPSLSEQLSRGPLKPEHALRIGVQLAGAVHTAHMLGIAHHDLKPSNVLTTEFGRVVLADFGIAGLVGASVGQVAGMSLPWAAPEVLRGEEAGTAADVYSLGATLYTAFYGRSPHVVTAKLSRSEYIDRVHQEPIPFPHIDGMDDAAFHALRDVLRRSLERVVAGRTANAADIGTGLQRVQSLLGHTPTDLEIPLH